MTDMMMVVKMECQQISGALQCSSAAFVSLIAFIAFGHRHLPKATQSLLQPCLCSPPVCLKTIGYSRAKHNITT